MLLEKLEKYDVILASDSPRRKQLLGEMGIRFRKESVGVSEEYPVDLAPRQIAEYLSKRKAGAFEKTRLQENSLLITADTIVTLDEQVLGKPAHREDAIRILRSLSGKPHDVITAVTLKTREKEMTFSVVTKVFFKELADVEINYYIDCFKPYDKAGAYGIQEWIGHAAIEKIEGSYFNVMGLPTHRLYEELSRFI
ncbi:MAG: Maf family nucleotide pyrophosphatase [bacterium]|jgi:septum formation protein